jgi:hypothetical protein
MIHAMACKLAELLGDGATIVPDRRSGHFSVGYTRPDGRYASIDEDAGALYTSPEACWDDWHVRGSEEGLIDARCWVEWECSERWARDFAYLIGGRAHHSGGNIWIVFHDRTDGRCALIGETGGGIMGSEEEYHTGAKADGTLCDDPEYVEWAETN